ncbi:MAG: hypothetical protein HC925_06170 [Coleofasciculaceae cyanobacterium SM2_3_26]|nr:hypothetical protein [Coleofasciculaceae cyanobacterium SM2_3_26]
MDVSSGFDRSAIAWLQHYSKHRFTGELQVRAVADATAQWSLFFCLGRLIWATGGCHPHRRISRIWRRHHLDKAFLGEFLLGDRSEVERYTLLADLLARRYLTQVQVQAIASDALQEVLLTSCKPTSMGNLSFKKIPMGR